MYKNVPAMNKNVQFVRNSRPPIKRPTRTPNMHKRAETTLKTRARFNETPALLNTAKSPISCGNS